MACFIVPAAEAVVMTVAAKVIEHKEKKNEAVTAQTQSGVNECIADEAEITETAEKIPFSRKLKWLSKLLWGGSVLLAFEHVWHGEVVPWFPFLSAASDPADFIEMLYEMVTVGVAMAVLVTAVWLGMLAVISRMEKREPIAQPVNGRRAEP